jgi:hypothetical protein
MNLQRILKHSSTLSSAYLPSFPVSRRHGLSGRPRRWAAASYHTRILGTIPWHGVHSCGASGRARHRGGIRHGNRKGTSGGDTGGQGQARGRQAIATAPHAGRADHRRPGRRGPGGRPAGGGHRVPPPENRAAHHARGNPAVLQPPDHGEGGEGCTRGRGGRGIGRGAGGGWGIEAVRPWRGDRAAAGPSFDPRVSRRRSARRHPASSLGAGTRHAGGPACQPDAEGRREDRGPWPRDPPPREG